MLERDWSSGEVDAGSLAPKTSSPSVFLAGRGNRDLGRILCRGLIISSVLIMELSTNLPTSRAALEGVKLDRARAQEVVRRRNILLLSVMSSLGVSNVVHLGILKASRGNISAGGGVRCVGGGSFGRFGSVLLFVQFGLQDLAVILQTFGGGQLTILGGGGVLGLDRGVNVLVEKR